MRPIALVFAAFSLLSPALSTAQDASHFIKAKHSEVEKVLHAKSVDPQKLSKVLEGLLNFEQIAQDSLGREWEKRSASERTAFTERLQRLIEDNYRKNVQTTAKYKIEYGEQSEKKGRIRVPTTAKSKSNRRAPAVEVVYWLIPDAEGFSVVDVETDGVGLVSTYKRQFRKILRSDGWEGLIKRMDERLSE